jgi:hypothetical protein
MLARAAASLFLVALLTGCSNTPTVAARTAPATVVGLPQMKTFEAPLAQAPQRANSEIARDVLDLTFRMESGRALPVLSRFEEPVRVAVTGQVPPSLGPDLERLIARLRSEAGLDIAPAAPGEAAQVVIEAVPQAEMRRAVPYAACFVVPNVASFDEFRRSRRSQVVDWTRVVQRTRAAIFVPADASPQELRDCLHEELAQAVGPLNDLYRLPDSVFNDDNIHSVLTGFDMLVLRVLNAPELASGMTREQVAARLPGLLARLNPAGERAGLAAVVPAEETPRSWIAAMERALSPAAAPPDRRAAAAEALSIAQANGWSDTRRGFAHYAFGRSVMETDTELALISFLEAERIFAARPETALHRAHVGVQLAAFALSVGQAEAALASTARHAETARRAENAALLATLLMMQAEAQAMLGDAEAARLARVDSLGWARYGFATEAEIGARLREIASLAPVRGAALVP